MSGAPAIPAWLQRKAATFAPEELLAGAVGAAIRDLRQEIREATPDPANCKDVVTFTAAVGRFVGVDHIELCRPVVVISGPRLAERQVVSPLVDPMPQASSAMSVARSAIRIAQRVAFGDRYGEPGEDP